MLNEHLRRHSAKAAAHSESSVAEMVVNHLVLFLAIGSHDRSLKLIWGSAHSEGVLAGSLRLYACVT